MAYIAPNSTIKFLRNCPLDDTYDHTLYFPREVDQSTYFSSLVPAPVLTQYGTINYTLTAQSYQRIQRGIRVSIPADYLYTCNYVMFQNTSFGSKWFYAFIDSVEYINNSVSEVLFTIDVIQTWLFDYHLDYCFIERQHWPTDSIGGNIEPEPVDCGEYVFNRIGSSPYARLIDFSSYTFVVMVADTEGSAVGGNVYDRVYSGCKLYGFDGSEVNDLNTFLAGYLSDPEAIVSIYVVPSALLVGAIGSDHAIPTTATGFTYDIVCAILTGSETLDGYMPRNKKLYSYPYNFYHVDNGSGESLCLRYEFFQNQQPVLHVEGTITQPVGVTLKPASYKGVANYSELGGYTTLNTECIKLANFPMCAWVNDSFKAWVAQNSIPLAGQVLGEAAVGGVRGYSQPVPQSRGGGIGGAFGAVGGIAGSLFGSAINVLTQAYRESIRADVMRGSVNNGGVNCAHGKNNFYGGRCSITINKAQVIDDFFDRFGYAINRVAQPNIHARQHWTYIKTAGCTITGSVPCDDMKKICSIFDAGVTWWVNGSEVGNYGLTNGLLT